MFRNLAVLKATKLAFKNNLLQTQYLAPALTTATFRQFANRQNLDEKLQKAKQSSQFSAVNDQGYQVQIPKQDQIQLTQGVARFLRRVYLSTGAGVLGYLGTAKLVSMLAIANPMGLSIAGSVLALGGAISFSFFCKAPTFRQVRLQNGETDIVSEDSLGRKIAFWVTPFGLGLASAPFLHIVQAVNPAIIPASLLLTSLVFGGASIVPFYSKNVNWLSVRAGLTGGLLGLIGISFAGLLGNLIFGPNPFSAAMFNVNTYVGLLIFTGLVSADTANAVQMYKDGFPDHLGVTYEMFLNFYNIFIRIVHIAFRFMGVKDD